MNSTTRALTGAILGSAAMYWFDPSSGGRRRARLRDRLRHMARKAGRELDASARDIAHRAQGVSAKAIGRLNGAHVDDAIIAERVRSALGRVVGHPGAVDVTVRNGSVELKGAVLAEEYPRLMRVAKSVRGVRGVEDRLGVHESARSVSALQGGRERRPRRFELLEERWSPATRLLADAAGLALIAAGLRSRRPAGVLLGGILLARAMMNLPLAKLAGTRADAIRIRKTIHVRAPIERVFDAVSRWENFHHFMRNVRGVFANPDGTAHWCVAGPMGSTVEWDAETVRFEANKTIAWRSVPNAIVQHSGSISVRAENGGTCLDIQMSYSPAAGILGHGVAKLFGVDPKKELDEDLMRFKTFLEVGKAPHDSSARRRRRNGNGDARLVSTARAPAA